MQLYLPAGLLRRVPDDTDFSDLTASTYSPRAAWSETAADVLVLDFSPAPKASEQTAIRRRLVTVDADDEKRLADLLAVRADPNLSTAMRLWVNTELARYGE